MRRWTIAGTGTNAGFHMHDRSLWFEITSNNAFERHIGQWFGDFESSEKFLIADV